MNALFRRLFRAIKWDGQLFEEIISDATIQGQSVWAVVMFTMATAFGFFSLISGTAVNIGLLTTIVGWYVWAFSVFYIGTRILKGDSAPTDRKTIMRVMAFACAPGLFNLVALVPKIRIYIFIITSLWILATAVFGLKKVFPHSATFKIGVVTVVTWIGATLFQFILIATLLTVFGVPKSGS